ncbi:MAG TPA: cytochrome P450 [Marmoricola sp.]
MTSSARTATVAGPVADAKDPVGPRFGLVHLLRLRRDPLGHADWLKANYGSVYTMKVLGTEMYMVSGPDAAEALFVNREKVFASGPAWSHFIGPFFNRGLMLLDFEEHHHHRRIMQAAFSNEALHRYHAMLQPHIRSGIADWGEVGDPHLYRMFKELTLDLALEAFVGVELSLAEQRRINKAFIDAVRAGTSIIRRPVPGGGWARGLAARKVLEEFFYGALPEKRRKGGDDLFAQLCIAQSETGDEFTDDDVVNHMIFLLMAAHDTTTITMTSMANQLARSPEWQERCRTASIEAGPEMDYDAQLGLTDLDLVMKESLRLLAPVPSIPRVATRETVLDGYRIPEGAFVGLSPYQNHYMPEFWPDPYRFDPERFSSERHEDKVHRLAFEPFGGGVHKCIGMYFAGMQVRAIFHELLRTYRWSVPAGYEMPIDMVALPVPRDGLPVRLERL